MNDDLVRKLREPWFTNGCERYQLDAADRIEALTAERDGLLRCVTDNHVALCRAEAAEAERDRLREAGEKAICHITGYGEASTARIELRAALKGESHE